MICGDVVMAWFPFSTMKEQKLRPAIVFRKKGADYVVIPISTQKTKTQDIKIEPSFLKQPVSMQNIRLLTTSSIKIDTIQTLHNNLIKEKIATLEKEALDNLLKIVKDRLCTE